MTRYLATVNTPGYMPWDDDPPDFDTAQEAWEHLADERLRQLEDVELIDASDTTEDETYIALRKCASDDWLVCDFERVGVVYGSNPMCDPNHDLGYAYCVTIAEEEN